MPRPTFASALLAFSSLASAQELVPDKAIEIELKASDPRLEGHGPSRIFDYEVAFDGRLYLWATSNDFDPVLRVTSRDGDVLAKDDNSTGGATVSLSMQVQPNEALRIRVGAAVPATTGNFLLHLSEAPETAATRAAAAKALEELAAVRHLRDAQSPAEGRELVAKTVADLRSAAGARTSAVVAAAAKQLGFEAAARGAFAAAREAWIVWRDQAERTLPDDHADLQAARQNLAVILEDMGDLEGARVLEEKVLEVRLRTVPDDHYDLQLARMNLAVTIKELGDLQGARALQERVLAVFSRTLPDNDPDLQAARQNLAVTIEDMGDLEGARALFEKVLEVDSVTLSEGHPELQLVRMNLAATLTEMGDPAGARALQVEVLDVFSRTLPDEHPDLQAARGNLAITLEALGNFQDAAVLEEKVLEVQSRALPDDHPDLQSARLNLAITLERLGDLHSALQLLRKVLEVRLRTVADDHPDLQRTRGGLALAIAAQCEERGAGEPDGGAAEEERADKKEFVQLVGSFMRALVHSAREALLSSSSREAEERCASLLPHLGSALSFAAGVGVFSSDIGLEREAFVLSETTRGVAQASASLARRARGDQRYAELRGGMRAGSGELARLAQSGGTPDELSAAVARRDAAEQALIERARELSNGDGGLVALDPDALAATLAPDDALVAFRRYRRAEFAPGSTREISTERLCAHVVRAGGRIQRFELGPIEPIEQTVQRWHSALGVGDGRGLGVTASASSADGLQSISAELRALVFDPLLPALGGTHRLVFVLDDVLHVVPFDALPASEQESAEDSLTKQSREAELLGQRYRIGLRSTLRELLWNEAVPSGPDLLLALGGAAYSAAPAGTSDEESSASAADGEDGSSSRLTADAVSGGVSTLLRGGAWGNGFTPLPNTLAEARGIVELGARRSEGASSLALIGSDASRAAIEDLAPKARWLHLATHGWFAPESVRSFLDPDTLSPQSETGARMRAQERVKGASPMVLCGLALTGANLPADAFGRYPGLVTAEEIASWDLSNCELVVLSACDTNVGIRRAGQGVASLQKALQIAGARSVITSLWKVPDEATKELMLDFYRRLWVEKKPKSQALWEAKMKLRNAKDEQGRPLYSTRDWAAWVLTGDPN